MLASAARAGAAATRRGAVRQAAAMSSVAEPEVVVSHTGGVAHVTLNRPKAMNALTLGMIRTLTQELVKLNTDPEVTAVVLQGAGGKAFCAGGDIKVLSAGKDGSPEARAAQEAFFREEYILDHLIARSSAFKPYIALLDGVVMGGGFGVSIGASMRVATDTTRFAMPETAIGLFPDVGGSYYLPRLAPGLGNYLALTGAPILGAATVQAGLTTHHLGADAQGRVMAELPSCVSGQQVVDLVAANASSAADLQAATAGADTVAQAHLISRVFTHTSLEDMLSELGAVARDVTDEGGAAWAAGALKTLSRASPTSLAVSLAAQAAGADMTLEEVLGMEFAVALNCMRGVDFYEGVRALLVDKDRNPTWTPPSVPLLQQEAVLGHFALPEGVVPLQLLPKTGMLDTSSILDGTPRS